MSSLKEHWQRSNLYQRFEIAISIVLSGIVSLIILVSLFRLIYMLVNIAVMEGSALDSGKFQILFGMIMTVLIALEFNRSIIFALKDHSIVVSTQGIVLIAIMTVVRKIIIIDAAATTAASFIAFAILLIALGFLYWIVRQLPPKQGSRADSTD